MPRERASIRRPAPGSRGPLGRAVLRARQRGFDRRTACRQARFDTRTAQLTKDKRPGRVGRIKRRRGAKSNRRFSRREDRRPE